MYNNSVFTDLSTLMQTYFNCVPFTCGRLQHEASHLGAAPSRTICEAKRQRYTRSTDRPAQKRTRSTGWEPRAPHSTRGAPVLTICDYHSITDRVERVGGAAEGTASRVAHEDSHHDSYCPPPVLQGVSQKLCPRPRR